MIEQGKKNIVPTREKETKGSLASGSHLKRYYRVDEVAAYFSVSSRTIYRLIDDGEIKTLRIRDCIRISVEEVQAFEVRVIVDDY